MSPENNKLFTGDTIEKLLATADKAIANARRTRLEMDHARLRDLEAQCGVYER